MPAPCSAEYSEQLSAGVEQSLSSMTFCQRPAADEDQGSDSEQEGAQEPDGGVVRPQGFFSNDGGGGKLMISRSASLAPPRAAIPGITRDASASYPEALQYIGGGPSSAASIISLKQLPHTDDLSSLVGNSSGRSGGSILERVMQALPASRGSSRAGDTSMAEWHDK